MRFRFMSNGDTVFLAFFFLRFYLASVGWLHNQHVKIECVHGFFFFDTFWDRGDYLERNGIILWSLGYRSNHHMVCCCSNKLQIASSHEASYIKHHTWFIRKTTRRAACWSCFHACLKEIWWNCNIYLCILSWKHCLPNFKLTFDLLFHHDILVV